MARQLIIKGANFQANSFDNDKYVIEEITLTPISTHGYSTTTAPRAPLVLDQNRSSGSTGKILYGCQDLYTASSAYQDGHWGGYFFDVSQYAGCNITIKNYLSKGANNASYGAIFTNTNSVTWPTTKAVVRWTADANVLASTYMADYDELAEGETSARFYGTLNTTVPNGASYLYVNHRNISEYPCVVKVYVIRS